jgi:hypothetical protein
VRSSSQTLAVLANEEVQDMEKTEVFRWITRQSWMPAIICPLPLWLLSFAIMAEGFPRPPISLGLASISFYLAIAASVVLLWKSWENADLVLYSLVPLLLLFTFDEISTTYKTPFILLCAILLTIGILVYQRSDEPGVRVLVLLFVASVTLMMAQHAASNFWHMADNLGYVECFPDYQGCAPLTGQETPWWILFFHVWP